MLPAGNLNSGAKKLLATSVHPDMSTGDAVGLKKVYAAICELEKRFGPDLWAPAPLLKELAEKGSTFAQWDQQKQ